MAKSGSIPYYSSMPYYTPLRYPGGKRRLFGVVARLLEENELRGIQYAEPYAGGAAVGLSLLFEEYASAIHLNDLSRPIFAFWNSVLHATDDLCARVECAPVTMDEWHRQRAVLEAGDAADLTDLGFATLFLNRTNRSGIISGGVIGGKKQQGAWTMTARFNKPEIIRRIEKIGRYRTRIFLHQMDAIDFVHQELALLGDNSFAFLDPPYIDSGTGLYLNDYTTEGHIELATAVSNLEVPWICTYDRAAIDLGIYGGHRRIEYGLPYMAQGRHRGGEVMFISHDISLPPEWREAHGPVRITPQGSTYKLFGTVTHPNGVLG